MQLAVDALELIAVVIDPVETAIEACIRVDAVSRALPNWRSIVHSAYSVTRDQVTASFIAAIVMPDPEWHTAIPLKERQVPGLPRQLCHGPAYPHERRPTERQRPDQAEQR